jgi:hypothetical protein
MATTTNNGWTTPDDTDLVKDGALAIRDLGQEIDTSTNNGLKAWTAYTPTFTNFTLGNGTIDFKYAQIGKTVHLRGQITFGTTSSATGTIVFSVPVNFVTTSGGPIVGVGRFNDTGVQSYLGNAQTVTASTAQGVIHKVDGTFSTLAVVNATQPHTWGSTDVFLVNMTYQGV